MKELENLLDNAKECLVCETLTDVLTLIDDACSITLDLLKERGMTLSENMLVNGILELHSEVLLDLINETFDILPIDEELELRLEA